MHNDKIISTKLYGTLVKPSIVKAVLMVDASLKKSNTPDALEVGTLYSGEIVTILQDRGYLWYKVKKNNGRVGWVSRDVLWIPPDEPANTNMLDKSQIEGFVEWKNLASDTGYLVWVDIERQMTYILQRNDLNNNWGLLRRMLCTTGKNISPTKRGTYKIKERGEWFYSEVFQSGAMYWVRYSGSYLFHSIAMNHDRQVIEDTLGKKASAGCIRMTIEDSKWFYDSIPEGSTVYVY